MIFVTVGTQLPFPRLVAAMERHAAGTDEPVIVQAGPAGGGGRGEARGDGSGGRGDRRAGGRGKGSGAGEAGGRGDGSPDWTRDGSGEWPHLDLRTRLDPAEFDALFLAARVVVGHAGIGTILSARRHRRPLVILPRRHALGEHRNDHQLATARAVAALPGIHVAWEAEDLPPLLDDPALEAAVDVPGPALPALIARLRDFIAE